MNRFCIFSALCTLLCLTVGLHSVHANESKVDKTKWITLTVWQGQTIKLAFAAPTSGVWVKVTGVKNEKVEEAPTTLPALDQQNKYEAIGTEITVYGAIEKFTCYENGEQLTALDVRQNVNLTELGCGGNRLSSLDVRQNVNLTELWCSYNQLSSLDVHQNVNLTYLGCSYNQLSSLDVRQNAQLKAIWIHGNNFSTSTLNNLYCQLPDRSGKEKGAIYPVYKEGYAIDDLLARSSSKTITDAKNWAIQDARTHIDIDGITGNYTCGSSYGLTLTPATMLNSFTHQGGEWKTTVTSIGNWKIDESTLPNWLSVNPKQGNSGTQVTITVAPLTGSDGRRAAITFFLRNYPTTKQVILVRQSTKPPLVVTPAEGYTFSGYGETKANYFTVESTGAWKVTSSNTDWFPVETREGEAGTTQVTIKTEANSGKDERKTELTFALKDNAEIKQVVILKQKGALWVTPAESYTFPATGETKANYFTVESKGAWKVTSSNGDWCPVETKEGAAGTTQVTIKTEANSSKEERQTKLTFALKANAAIKQIVTLKQTGASFSVTPVESYTFSATAETKENYFTVESTGAWKVSSSNGDWFPVETKEGAAGTTQVTIKTEANSGKDERKTELTFALKANAAIKQIVTLKQTGASFSVTPVEDYIFPAYGETKENYYTVESTAAWKVTSSNADWFPVETREGEAGTTKVTITAEANSSKEERETKLSFALKDNAAIKQVVTLKQIGATLSVTPAEGYTFSASGETKESYFTVESTRAWKVTSSNTEWNPVDTKEGAAGRTGVTISAEANSSKEERQTELTFALKDNAAIKQVVTLKQKGVSLSVTPAEGYTFPASGETKENYFTVESSRAWKVTSSNADWFPVDTQEGNSGTTKVTITAEANNGKAGRQTELTFALKANAEVKQVVILKQKGALLVTPIEEYTFPASGETKANYFTVESTGAWKVTSSNADWCPVEIKEGAAGTTQITITAEANSNREERQTVLTFALKDKPNVKQVVTLKQKGASLSVIPTEEYTFPATGETKANYFTVESTGAWKVTSSNADWCPVETKEGEAGTTQITITAEANSNREERQTELTFALKANAEIKQVVTLKQKGASLSVTPTDEYTFPATGETKANYFTVESTGAWKVTSSNADWCPVETKEGAAGTTQVTIKTERNYSTKDRKTELTFALQANAEVKQVVMLKQSGASLSVTPAEGYTFPALGETKANYFTVESKEAWKVTSSNADWCPVETKEGAAGTTQVTIKSDANNSKEERTTELTFALKDNAEVKQVVTLKQKGISISVTPSAGYTFSAAGETKENYFTVESTGAWKVTSSNAAWFPVETREGEAGTTQVTIKSDANNSKEARTTELTFALKDKPEIKQVVTLKQAGQPTAVESVLLAGISVAPNPFSSQLRIKNEEAVNARFELVNTSGVVVRSGVLQGVETVLNTEDLTAGAYLLRILSGSESKTLRVVKE